MQFRVAVLALFCSLTLEVSAAEKSAREAYDQLTALRVDSATLYEIDPANRIELRRGDVRLSFEQGKLAFLQPFEGRVTGAVFLGRGHILAAPRDPVEKQQMAHFLGAPVLDQDFTFACLRFTDDTSADLLRQLSAAAVSPQQDSAFANSKAILRRLHRRRRDRALRFVFGPSPSGVFPARPNQEERRPYFLRRLGFVQSAGHPPCPC